MLDIQLSLYLSIAPRELKREDLEEEERANLDWEISDYDLCPAIYGGTGGGERGKRTAYKCDG